MLREMECFLYHSNPSFKTKLAVFNCASATQYWFDKERRTNGSKCNISDSERAVFSESNLKLKS